MVLEIISVSLKRNKRIIFDNFNLKLCKSQIMILIGDNGVGKTSLLDLISGILQPEKGYIKINNVLCEDLNSSKRQLFTYLPHKDALKENLTIEENLEIWSKISSSNNDKSKFDNIFSYFQLNTIKKNLVGNLSQGQRKKVSLTKLLLTNTNLWLLDEPFNGLDKTSVIKTKKLIEDHSKKGGTILLTNHININFKNSLKTSLFNLKINSKKNKSSFESWEDF